MKHSFRFTNITEDINVNIIKVYCLRYDILAKSKFTFTVTHKYRQICRFSFLFTLE
jgi:hypothetical protein